MKTSTFLTLSTSVLVGLLDVSSALSPPTRDYHSSSSLGDPSSPSRTYEYNFGTKTSSISGRPPVHTESPRPVKEYPYVLDIPESPDIAEPPPIPDSELAKINSFESEIYFPIPIPDTELLPDLDLPPSFTEPPPIGDPDFFLPELDYPPITDQTPSNGGYYEGPNGTKIAVKINPPGFGENPKDRGDTPNIPQPPPPLPGDVVYGDGVKHYPVNANTELAESESALMLSDVTGKEPSQVSHKRNLGDVADDFLADVKKGYEGLKNDIDDVDFPDFGDFGDLSKYFPSKFDVAVNVDGNVKISDPPPTDIDVQIPETSDPPPPPPPSKKDFDLDINDWVKISGHFPHLPQEQDIDSTVIFDHVPKGETIEEPVPPKWHSRHPPQGYGYHVTLSGSPPAKTTFATVTRTLGSAHPTNSFGYKYTLPK